MGSNFQKNTMGLRKIYNSRVLRIILMAKKRDLVPKWVWLPNQGGNGPARPSVRVEEPVGRAGGLGP